jgi:hypothetical protein
MKKSFFLLLPLAFIVMLIQSCNEDIDMAGDFKETAVVYGLLDQADSLHYIRINRAFIGPGNSLEFAQIPDSNYFDNIDATITELVGGQEIRQWTLRDTLIDNKETNGVFFAPQQKVYYFVTRKCQADGSQQLQSGSASNPLSSLNENAIYKLNLSINGGEMIVSGETALVKDITSPSVDPVAFRYDFIENDGSYAQNGLKVNTGNSHVLNTTLEIGFYEIATGVDTNLRTFRWNLGEFDVQPNGSKSFNMPGETFFNLVKSNCTTNSSINKRKFSYIKAIMTGGSEDLYNYMLINQPTTSLAQNKPTYTNLTVNEGFRVAGIFSARYTYSVTKTYINPFNNSLRMLTAESVEQLCIGPITGALFFCSQHPADLGESYFCN